MSLLKQAKSKKLENYKKFDSKELAEVAIAWLEGEIAYSQVANLRGISRGSVYNLLSFGIREAYRNGKITIKK